MLVDVSNPVFPEDSEQCERAKPSHTASQVVQTTVKEVLSKIKASHNGVRI